MSQGQRLDLKLDNYLFDIYLSHWENRGSGQSVDCPQSGDPRFAQQSMDYLQTLHRFTLCATQSQAPQTKGIRRNCKEILQSAAQGDVRDSNLELGILHCSLWI